MIADRFMVDGIAVEIRVYDRDKGDGCCYVDGETWCPSPGGRFLCWGSFTCRGKNYQLSRKWDDEPSIEEIRARIAVIVRRRISTNDIPRLAGRDLLRLATPR